MGQINLSGSLSGGPAVGGENTFPAAQFITPLKLSSNHKSFTAGSGLLTRQLSDDAVFVPLAALGAAGDVTRANFLYLRANGDYQLRITQDDGVGGTTVQTLQCRGLFVCEFPDALAAVLVEVAADATIEYLVSGPA
jgi:hypothetical protein